jgi:hypothetical protein
MKIQRSSVMYTNLELIIITSMATLAICIFALAAIISNNCVESVSLSSGTRTLECQFPSEDK